MGYIKSVKLKRARLPRQIPIRGDPIMAFQSTYTFINLPVKDLKRTRAFFESIGFEFNPQYSGDEAICLVINDTTYAMLLLDSYFRTFIKKPVADVSSAAGAIIALSADSRAQVDELADKALAAGAKPSNDPADHGFMYVRSFEDLDGHLWEIAYMDPNAAMGHA